MDELFPWSEWNCIKTFLLFNFTLATLATPCTAKPTLAKVTFDNPQTKIGANFFDAFVQGSEPYPCYPYFGASIQLLRLLQLSHNIVSDAKIWFESS